MWPLWAPPQVSLRKHCDTDFRSSGPILDNPTCPRRVNWRARQRSRSGDEHKRSHAGRRFLLSGLRLLSEPRRFLRHWRSPLPKHRQSACSGVRTDAKGGTKGVTTVARGAPSDASSGARVQPSAQLPRPPARQSNHSITKRRHRGWTVAASRIHEARFPGGQYQLVRPLGCLVRPTFARVYSRFALRECSSE